MRVAHERKLPWPARMERNTRVVELYADGLNCREIGEQLGIPHATVVSTLRTAGIDTAANRDHGRSVGRQHAKRDAEIAKARALGAKLRELAERYGVSRQRIDQIVKRRTTEVAA